MFENDDRDQFCWWHWPLDFGFRAGAIILPLPIALLLREHWRVAWQDTRHGPENLEFYPYITWFTLTLLGIALAIKGINFTPASRALRVSGLFKILIGTGTFTAAFIGTAVFVILLQWAGVAVVFTGAMIVGFVTAFAGVLQAITGNVFIEHRSIFRSRAGKHSVVKEK